MTNEEQHLQNGQAFFSAVDRSSTWVNVVGFGPPDWAHELASSLALAAIGEDLDYVTLGGSAEGNDLFGAGFTQSRMITFTVHFPDGGGDAVVEITVRGLKDLESLRVRTSQPLGTKGFGLEWPGTPSAKLRFRDGFSFDIPASSVRRSEDREPLADVVRRLPAHLS